MVALRDTWDGFRTSLYGDWFHRQPIQMRAQLQIEHMLEQVGQDSIWQQGDMFTTNQMSESKHNMAQREQRQMPKFQVRSRRVTHPKVVAVMSDRSDLSLFGSYKQFRAKSNWHDHMQSTVRRLKIIGAIGKRCRGCSDYYIPSYWTPWLNDKSSKLSSLSKYLI
ncbi:hypothetical protein K474DRAFT_1675627 [Panus rudis PR-1116 ss-1]|nr:hypothetical protein K474DRAFT_1675627 [Panus rudis PR-1116 ss-1]